MTLFWSQRSSGLRKSSADRGSSGSTLDRNDQVPEVGADGELRDVHAHAGVVADLGLLAADQGEQVVAVQRRLAVIERRQTQGRDDGRQQVDGLDQGLVPYASLCCRSAAGS